MITRIRSKGNYPYKSHPCSQRAHRTNEVDCDGDSALSCHRESMQVCRLYEYYWEMEAAELIAQLELIDAEEDFEKRIGEA